MGRTNHIQWIALPLAVTELRDGREIYGLFLANFDTMVYGVRKP